MAVRERVAESSARTVEKFYQSFALPIIRKRFNPGDPETGAHAVHEYAMRFSAFLDDHPRLAQPFFREWYRLIYEPLEGEYLVGGVILPTDIILAAGWVKGLGFRNEADALLAVKQGINIIPGHASVPPLTGGVVEFGSYTRWPRMGNEHPSIWRQEPGSAQNRVGLTNPGVRAAAAFLSKEEVRTKLPTIYGINIAVTPGLKSIKEEVRHVKNSFGAFVEDGVIPAWFTLNISCPNTEDDPHGNQTKDKVRKICRAAVSELKGSGQDIPLWVKVSPNLGEQQYKLLYTIFAEEGVRAVIATNTRGEPAPNDSDLTAGISGRELHNDSVDAARWLITARRSYLRDNPDETAPDIIGCGGVESGATYWDFGNKVAARQLLTAILFRGPTASALIRQEASR